MLLVLLFDSMVTLLGTPVQYNALKDKSSAMNSAFVKFLMFTFW